MATNLSMVNALGKELKGKELGWVFCCTWLNNRILGRRHPRYASGAMPCLEQDAAKALCYSKNRGINTIC